MSIAVEAAFVPAPLAASSVAEDPHELTIQEVHAALSDLGHNHLGELVYTKCTLSSKGLSRLPGLERYGNLQQLILDHNALTELTAVRYMPQLVYLSARHNKLTSDVFECLAGAAGCLERLHLDGNCLTSLSGLESLPFLTDVTCSENRIASVSARCLSGAHRLMRLRLNHNCISSIEVNAFEAASHLRTLELAHNALTKVSFLRSVSSQMERLTLADNRIAHLGSAVQHLEGLTVLDVRRNALNGLTELEALCTLTALRTLFFDGNEDLNHLPYIAGAEFTADPAMQQPSAGRTEYHAEVVMSDEENDDAGQGADLLVLGMAASSQADERSFTVGPTNASAADAAAGSGRWHDKGNAPPFVGGNKMDDSLSPHHHPTAYASATAPTAAAAAPPTTASYVALAATETHNFIRTVGSAARDAALCVKVDNAREISALPREEQVYLWTLAVLPHLLELNGRTIHADEVARASFLFATKPES
ncbi:hypothetical protein ABB37_05082 [Leptomonas pyrrhocoris]|uniref:Leucine-rich repeat protein n=1 Tax=Leptomonas pyrrhocoris TaxID=157538 RepID=A0A0N0VF55_LEPPY|nr:hypothetical protein ABB37_05082 [Leptomonas pyrrhocoris]XP_015658511.1 hypothetical protein ABB37_05082 [Leptomonas pyrrhocoris]KPA80071.1 hypothetical protein ABB37_05082 [Leptomonas pyrrhocoris]KPA80072.1 hypothetical protein ABB37_05082 [Leptomonas pyrrhocoris]|eukprot:XP_015658510.1 hypothetical protein ABB37_05082 [Leptomonas pyrrhocoris]